MLNHIKTLKVGDKVGNKTIKEIRTDVEDDYYHDAGLVLVEEKKDGDTEENFDDVYSLTSFNYDALMKYDSIQKEIINFFYANYQAVFDEIADKSKTYSFFFSDIFIKKLYDKFNKDIDFETFNELLPQKFKIFIEQLYIIKKSIE
jgi:hypothetical protein